LNGCRYVLPLLCCTTFPGISWLTLIRSPCNSPSAVHSFIHSFIHSLFTFHWSSFGYNTSGYRNRQIELIW
jgi:hypothetical protein